jgi:hypothetical protein
MLRSAIAVRRCPYASWKKGLEGWVHLGGWRFPPVKFLEGEDVGLEENADGVHNDLVIGIWKFSNFLDFLTLLDAVEEHFRLVGGGQWALEQGVVVKQCHHIWLSIWILELVKDYVRRYLMVLRRVPEFKYEIGLQSKP